MTENCSPDTDLKCALHLMGEHALEASRKLSLSSTDERNTWLNLMADALERDTALILEANEKDLADAKVKGLDKARVERLILTPDRIKGIADALRHVATLPDPVGRILSSITRPNGLRIDKVSVPLGVIGIIYESRPNVTVDAAGLCIKSGNAVILRGGGEAYYSNQALANCIRTAGEAGGMPENSVQLVPFKGHEAVSLLLKMDDCINVMIPRGGERLIRAVVEQATMPVIKHYKGVCHIFVDRDCRDWKQALNIIGNAKCQRPGVCNALETILVDEAAAPQFAPALAEYLNSKGVEIRGDETFRRFADSAAVIPAVPEDWPKEYLDLIVSVKVVSGVDEAIRHINRYGSGHSDCILTQNVSTAETFLNGVDSAAVYWNASTRFTDGGEFGMGAEMGISTDKLHVRGPMGLEELNSYKYKIYGEGQIRS